MSILHVVDQSQLQSPTAVSSLGDIVLSANYERKDTAAVEDSLVVATKDVETSLVVEQVAQVLAGIPAIGWARRALEVAGWHATIAGNRITVNDEVFAQFIAATLGKYGRVDASWVIYAIAGTPPVWIVGADDV